MNKKYFNTGRTNQKLGTRRKILDSAQYFLHKGVSFNLEDVAKKSGVSRATIYRYYSNVEVLATEASLDISTKTPEELYEKFKENSLNEQIYGVQGYFNVLAIDHENAFRKYLSAVVVSTSSEAKRGARRKKTLQLVLENSGFTVKEKKDLSNLFTIFMGIEPLIVSKDVCGLNNNESLDLMTMGMDLLLKGIEASRKK